MNLAKLSLCSLRFRALNSVFNVCVLALGMATIVTLLHVGQQVEQRFTRDLEGIDLVVGAKGSPIQLILSSVFHLDIPNGNIPLAEAEKFRSHPLVKSAIPVALGDSYHGFRIVGTTRDYPQHYHAELAQGAYWAVAMEAVLGSEVARASQLKPGDTFAGSHGLSEGGEEHAASPYRVVGILKPTGTVIDRLVLTGVESVWHVHEHEQEEGGHDAGNHEKGGREITSLLITYKSPMAAVTLPRLVNKTSSMQAASPAFEAARLLQMIGTGSDTVALFAAVLMVIAALGFFVTLWSAVNERSYDIALMRSLGATRRKVLALVVAEGLTLGAAGTLLGLALGHAFARGAQAWIESTRHLTLNPVGFHADEPYAVLIALAISLIASIIPAWTAYRANIADILSRK